MAVEPEGRSRNVLRVALRRPNHCGYANILVPRATSKWIGMRRGTTFFVSFKRGNSSLRTPVETGLPTGAIVVPTKCVVEVGNATLKQGPEGASREGLFTRSLRRRPEHLCSIYYIISWLAKLFVLVFSSKPYGIKFGFDT